jgi:hypothetical protein
MIYLAIIVLSLLAGCSPVSRIANNTNDIRTEAQLLAEHGTAVNDPVVVSGATRIDTLAAGIHVALTGVEEKTPPWMSMLTWIAIAAVVVAVCVLLWQTGLGTAVRVMVGWLPRKKVSQAELAVDMLDPSRAESGREMIAAMRSDPEFDAAFRKAQSRRKA